MKQNYTTLDSFFHTVKLLGKGNVCYFCKSAKTQHTFHCDVCHKCVMKFDHHCYYISNCVGRDNICFFLGFLFNLTVYLTGELILNVMITLQIFEYRQEWDFMYRMSGVNYFK